MLTRLATTILIALLSLPGCALLTSGPRLSATDYRNEIEGQISRQEYDAAMDNASRALSEYPAEGYFHLQKGELSEVKGKIGKARSIYRKALKKLPPTNPWRSKIIYRLGLLEALSRNDPEEATKRLQEISPDSTAHIDLRAAIAISRGDARGALTILNESIGRGVDKPEASRMLLHAAMAYDLLGDTEKALASLYKAINVAGKTLIVPQIEAFWLKIKRENPQDTTH